jgi:hypothetical protein
VTLFTRTASLSSRILAPSPPPPRPAVSSQTLGNAIPAGRASPGTAASGLARWDQSSFEPPARDFRRLKAEDTGFGSVGDALGKLKPKPAGEDPYRVPNEEEDYSVDADEAQRTPDIARKQEDAVQRAIETGKPVLFINSNGEVERISVRKDGDDYLIQGEDGHELRIHAEAGYPEDRLAEDVAALTDYYSQVPEHLRGQADRINLHPGDYRANYVPDSQTINLGSDDIDEKTFDHEWGHAIGSQTAAQGDSWLERALEKLRGETGTPEGWAEAQKADGSAPSEYSHEAAHEDFAESWLAYVEAREKGPEALAALEQKYPHRYAILESVYNGTYEG